ncbi:MAG: hypothetical protein U1D64_01580, partial [Bacteroidales bacterium]|nr:hypothetical protein [Bacteroidales bacterium]
MRLITEKGQIVLPVDFEFEIEEHSPVFSNKGAQSLPVNLPDQVNNIVLSHPSRPGKSAKLVRKIPAKLEAGIIHKSGQLIIDTAHSGKGITGAIMINESDLYSQIKEMTLSEVFEKIVRTDFTTPQAWYNHIYSCMTGASSDDFTAFPVAVDLQEVNYQMLNSPDVTSETTPWALMWSARRTAYGSDAVNVPAGYGITPFLWLWRALELLFADFGYSVSKNPFKTDLFLQKIVLVNNTADSICKGELNYADLVPSCKISEFIKFIEQKFSTHLYVYPEAKIIDIIPVADVITSTPQMDVTPFLDGSEEYIFSELQELDITSDTSLEGASPAAETIFDLANKYSHLSELDEHDFRNNAWRYNLVLRRATGEYYEILQKYNTTSIKKVRLGTNYFRHFTNRLPAKECNSEDMIPPMVDMNFGISGAKERRVICPYIGSSQHRNTSYKDQQKGGEQKIIIALFAGLSDEDSNIEAKYCLGTTQKYSNLGNQWSAFDLTSSDIYDLFHKEWNKVLMNSGVSVEAKVDYSPENLLALRLDRP